MCKLFLTLLIFLFGLQNQQPQQAEKAVTEQQEKTTSNANVKFDTTVYDFGKVTMKDGPLSCSFNLTNESEEDLTIFAVVSSCGCTEVSWTRETIKPGGRGEVKATFSNDEGPYPFDKAITVYTSADRRPIILHLKGDVVKEKKPKK